MNLGKIPTKTARLDPDCEALIDIPNNPLLNKFIELLYHIMKS